MNPVNWIKSNKLVTLLILVILYFVFVGNSSRPYSLRTPSVTYPGEMGVSNMGFNGGMVKTEMAESMPAVRAPSPYNPESTDASATDRRVVTENYLSLQVSDVPEMISSIKSKAESLRGFMVNANVSRPEESASGTITIRIPVSRSDGMISFLKENSIKVVNEDMQGRDITDQYQDIESRLNTLQTNKARFEEIMEKAETIDDILRVQTQVFQLQTQIESLIGQREYLRNTSETVKITAYLATDEYSLPYVPNTSWRPEAVFKEAIRSLVMDLRSIGNTAIWLSVYAVIWLPLLAISLLVIRYWKARKSVVKSSKK